MRFSLAILLLLLGASAPAFGEQARGAEALDAVTLRLTDGRIVLLEGLIAPNAADDGPRAAADRIAARALAMLIEQAVGRKIDVAPLQPAADRWGRVLGDVSTQQAGWLQGLMLRQGLVRISVCPIGGADRLKMLRGAEAEARLKKRGLWRIGAYHVRAAAKPVKARGFVLIQGVPVSHGGGRKARYLNFAEDWRTDFTLRMTKKTERLLARAGLDFDTMLERKLLVRGWLVWRNGPMLDITCPQQIEALDP